MKPKNFPARKVARQLKAQGIDIESHDAKSQISNARGIRTKKTREAKK